MSENQTVYLVDDDEYVLKSLTELISAAGLQTRSFHSAEEFLDQLEPDARGCVITDLKMNGMSGERLQEELKTRRCRLPVIVVSGHADVPITVRMMENGAFTLLQKPYNHRQLLEAVRQALTRDSESQDKARLVQDLRERLSRLTEEEQQVMHMVIAGKPNKAIASELGISMRTVDRRRSAVFDRLDVRTAPELARLLTQVEQAARTLDAPSHAKISSAASMEL